jgi:hypothetical protein
VKQVDQHFGYFLLLHHHYVQCEVEVVVHLQRKLDCYVVDLLENVEHDVDDGEQQRLM